MSVEVTMEERTGGPQRPSLLRQLLLGLGLFGLYLAVDAFDSGRRQVAMRHGRAILGLERSLHLDVERTLNAWLAPHPALATLANYEYAYTYVLSALALFAWVWLRRPEQWRFARDSFVLLNLLSIATFLLVPTAPPRMLSELGFVDTVSSGGTVGSWGSGIVDTANQVAAMPSLHVGWALWVSVVLARFTAGTRVQLLSAFHVLLTVVVVMATANHYLLDAVAVVIPVVVGTGYATWRYDAPAGESVPSCDAFFLHVEATGAPQHVGGVVSLGDGDGPTLEEVRRLAEERLAALPHLRKRLEDRSRWRRPRWVDVRVDVRRQVTETTAWGPRALEGVLASLAETPLPRDRPLWRLVLVHSGDANTPRHTIVVLVHHSVADGIGTILTAMRLFDPAARLPVPARGRSAGGIRRALAVTAGLAQLATDGGAEPLGSGTGRRDFALVNVPFDPVRRAARTQGVRVTDLVIALTVDAVRLAAPQLLARSRGGFKVSVPLMLRSPDSAVQGNATAAIIVEVPTDGTLEQLVDQTARRSVRLRRPTRAVASRFVMATGLRLLPEPGAAWFARTVYGRRFFHLIVSNLPGPQEELRLLGRVPSGVYPVLPLAPGTPLALGALTWGGQLGIGIATDPGLLDAAAVARHLEERLVSADAAGGMSAGDDTSAGALPSGTASVGAPMQREEEPRP